MYHYQKATYAVMGNPIAHSKSPLIHRLFAEQTQEQLDYLALYVPENQFKAAVKQFQLSQGLGLNITVPFKAQAWQLCDKRTERAELAEAVNTLWFKDDQIYGDNTDGIGLVQDLKNHQIDLKNKQVLMLGAGGAVRGILQPLLNQLPHSLTIVNRSIEKAEQLAQQYQYQSVPIKACTYQQLDQNFDVIINATSLSLQGKLPPLNHTHLHKNTCLYDLFYSTEDTCFVAWGKQHHINAYDGLGMLIEQAAAAFLQWRGTMPDTQAVINHLKP